MIGKAIFLGCAISAIASQAVAQEWTPLFNGQDLSGWTVKCKTADRSKAYWSVADGEIVVNSMGDKDHNYVWLQHGGEFTDFELRLKFKIYKDSLGNSGIQIRSRYDDEAEWLDGPQFDIHPPNPLRAGLIYDETRDTKRWIHPSLEHGDHNILPSMANPKIKLLYGGEGWNEMVITAKGTQLTCVVNGEVASEYDGHGVLDDAAHQKHNVGMQGRIALQLHNKNELKARFKDIKIRELKPE
ncbi:3-keto-disaccharide hydrolase [Pontiella sulfatireligans]|uniref:3-keto-alpha-glucoside-1,2-lyase/3-keto-2-hydroxy-glucal hydratase domain-containing protein n=1 Tax=Pontiella sulfatireligans TaxID=2750658 RepID=A0A6C2UK94_9BACT|nr:DUF1080 domain-containing protein [Pontiella sulfatireligans]VGO19847.1 hypothetical protein SCARR_01907 [Pontiella sulfatireligans]